MWIDCWQHLLLWVHEGYHLLLRRSCLLRLTNHDLILHGVCCRVHALLLGVLTRWWSHGSGLILIVHGELCRLTLPLLLWVDHWWWWHCWILSALRHHRCTTINWRLGISLSLLLYLYNLPLHSLFYQKWTKYLLNRFEPFHEWFLSIFQKKQQQEGLLVCWEKPSFSLSFGLKNWASQ